MTRRPGNGCIVYSSQCDRPRMQRLIGVEITLSSKSLLLLVNSGTHLPLTSGPTPVFSAWLPKFSVVVFPENACPLFRGLVPMTFIDIQRFMSCDDLSSFVGVCFRDRTTSSQCHKHSGLAHLPTAYTRTGTQSTSNQRKCKLRIQ